MTRKVHKKFNISTTKTSFASPLDISIDSRNCASTAQAPAHHSHLGFRKTAHLASQPFSPSLKPEFYLGLRNLALQPFSSSLKPESICPAPHPGDKVADHPHHPEKCCLPESQAGTVGHQICGLKVIVKKDFICHCICQSVQTK